MNKFIDLLNKLLAYLKEDGWFKPRTIITCAFYATFLYLILNEVNIPPALNTIVSNLFGYWFGSKTVKKEA
jgi:hypothetical protein